jgi:hypothetical protein
MSVYVQVHIHVHEHVRVLVHLHVHVAWTQLRTPEVSRPLFWSAGPLSAVQQTTEMIADQRTGKNSRPAQAHYWNWASIILLFCIFWPVLKIFQRKKLSNNWGWYWYCGIANYGIANCGIANCNIQWTTVKIAVAELQNCGLDSVDYSENSRNRISELRTSGSTLRKN